MIKTMITLRNIEEYEDFFLLNEGLSVYGIIALVHFGKAAFVAAYFPEATSSISFFVLIDSLTISICSGVKAMSPSNTVLPLHEKQNIKSFPM